MCTYIRFHELHSTSHNGFFQGFLPEATACVGFTGQVCSPGHVVWCSIRPACLGVVRAYVAEKVQCSSVLQVRSGVVCAGTQLGSCLVHMGWVLTCVTAVQHKHL